MRLARFANPVLAGLAGSRLVPLWAAVGAAIGEWPAPLRLPIRLVGIKHFLRLRTR